MKKNNSKATIKEIINDSYKYVLIAILITIFIIIYNNFVFYYTKEYESNIFEQYTNSTSVNMYAKVLEETHKRYKENNEDYLWMTYNITYLEIQNVVKNRQIDTSNLLKIRPMFNYDEQEINEVIEKRNQTIKKDLEEQFNKEIIDYKKLSKETLTNLANVIIEQEKNNAKIELINLIASMVVVINITSLLIYLFKIKNKTLKQLFINTIKLFLILNIINTLSIILVQKELLLPNILLTISLTTIVIIVFYVIKLIISKNQIKSRK